jgi:hypothetical protein
MYDCVTGCGVDPRALAGRIMDIRSQLASEFVQDLKNVAEARARGLRGRTSGMLQALPQSELVMHARRAPCGLLSASPAARRAPLVAPGYWDTSVSRNTSTSVLHACPDKRGSAPGVRCSLV